MRIMNKQREEKYITLWRKIRALTNRYCRCYTEANKILFVIKDVVLMDVDNYEENSK